jgi:nitrogen fixation NifU-like protein
MSDDYIPSQIILDYYANPVNYEPLVSFDVKVVGKNKNCSDVVSIYLKLSKDLVIKKISFKHSGCVISKAGMCVLTELVKNKSLKEISSFDEKIIVKNLGGVLQTRTRCAFLGLNLLKVITKDVLKKKIIFPKTYVLEV